MRTATALITVVAAIALSACGSDDEQDVGPTAARVTASVAKASVERSAGVTLQAEQIPDEAREQGLEAAYSNVATAATDRQAVVLFLMDDAARVAEKIEDLRRGSAAPPTRMIVHDNVIVVYAAAGTDRADRVEQAVEAL